MRTLKACLCEADKSVLRSLDRMLLDDKGNMIVRPYALLKTYPRTALQAWAVLAGYYCIPTTDLIEWLKANFVDKADGLTIEICAGNGAIGRALGIPMTDSYVQTEPEMVALYKALGQKPISPPSDVEKAEANEAVDKYKPHTVIGSFVTQKFVAGDDGPIPIGSSVYGVDEVTLLNKVSRYVMIGNDYTHADKRIMPMCRYKHSPPGLITRCNYPEADMVYEVHTMTESEEQFLSLLEAYMCGVKDAEKVLADYLEDCGSHKLAEHVRMSLDPIGNIRPLSEMTELYYDKLYPDVHSLSDEEFVNRYMNEVDVDKARWMYNKATKFQKQLGYHMDVLEMVPPNRRREFRVSYHYYLAHRFFVDDSCLNVKKIGDDVSIVSLFCDKIRALKLLQINRYAQMLKHRLAEITQASRILLRMPPARIERYKERNRKKGYKRP